jgi:hypothetical protein
VCGGSGTTMVARAGSRVSFSVDEPVLASHGVTSGQPVTAMIGSGASPATSGTSFEFYISASAFRQLRMTHLRLNSAS